MVSKAVRGSPPLACIDSLRGRRELGFLLCDCFFVSHLEYEAKGQRCCSRGERSKVAHPGDGSSEEIPVQPGLPAQESKFADQGIREALIRGQFRKAWNSKGRTDPFPPGLPWPSETLPGCCAESPFRDRHLKKPRLSGTNSASVCLSSSCLLKGLL